MEIALGVLALSLVIAAAIVAFAVSRRQPLPENRPDPRIDAVILEQGKIQAQFSGLVTAQNKFADSVGDLTQALSKSLQQNTEKTVGIVSSIEQRLNTIDQAQENIKILSSHVVSLEAVLANKQQRGAFGQERMEDIVRDILPSSMYAFNAQLSNGTRPDCTVRLPGSQTLVVIDSKFPWEAFASLRNATNDDEKKAGASRVRTDVQKHVHDIATKYLIDGETQAPAVMFVPSESIYEELHESFRDLITRAYRLKVTIVSPNFLMLALNTILALARDAKMREQADVIQGQVGLLLKDVERLEKRTEKLQGHFNDAQDDIKDILISSGKITKRGGDILSVEIADVDPAKLPLPASKESAS